MTGVDAALIVVAVVALLIGSLVLFTAITARRVERALPPAGRFVNVNGARIHYIERGTGPVTLLMVYGLGGNALHYTHSVVERLAAEFRVIVMDREGSGYSIRAAGAATGPAAQAETVAACTRYRPARAGGPFAGGYRRAGHGGGTSHAGTGARAHRAPHDATRHAARRV